MTNAHQSISSEVSHWQESAPPYPPTNALIGTAKTDVVIIGAGISALVAALYLRKSGASVIVIDAGAIGGGATPRGSGIILPALRYWNSAAIKNKNYAVDERLYASLRTSARGVFDLVRNEGLAADAIQNGTIVVADEGDRAHLANNTQTWIEIGANISATSGADLTRLTGSRKWSTGAVWHDGGTVDPRATTIALTQKVLSHGATIYSNTPALSFGRAGLRWVVTTAKGRVDSRGLILATNAYTGAYSKRLANDIADSARPYVLWHASTKKLSEDVFRSLPPQNQPIIAPNAPFTQLRHDGRGGLVFSGLTGPRIAPEKVQMALRQAATTIFELTAEQSKTVQIANVWSTRGAMTASLRPQFHNIGPDGYASIGGEAGDIALAVWVGHEFAKAMMGTPHNELALPFTEPEPQRLSAMRRLFGAGNQR